MKKTLVCSIILLVITAVSLMANAATQQKLPLNNSAISKPTITIPNRTTIKPPRQNPIGSQYASHEPQELAVGYEHACTLKSGEVWCWGTGPNYFSPTNSWQPSPIQNLNGVTEITAGLYFMCALINDGTVKCWGMNDYGQLGDGTTTSRNTPALTNDLTNVTQITSDHRTSCALIKDGTVKCWGYNGYGQIGDGTKTDKVIPTKVEGLNGVVSISTGGDHTCALLNDQTVKCWGENLNGAVGDGSNENRLTPTSVDGLDNVISVKAGGSVGYTCALLEDKTVKCWGSNQFGKLGNGSTTMTKTPISVKELNNVREIAVGRNHTCAILENNDLKCWGSNEHGELGDGSNENRSIPTKVFGISDVFQVSTRHTHTCAIKTDKKSVWCWGLEIPTNKSDPTKSFSIPTQVPMN